MKATLNDLMWSERSKAYRAIADLKRSIKKLETISPRTSRIETALKEAKDTETQLCQAVKKPAFIEALIMTSVMKSKTSADRHSRDQKQKRDKRQIWGGLTRKQLSARNQKMIEHFKRTHLSRSGFAKKHAAKYDLKSRQVMDILKMAVCSLPG